MPKRLGFETSDILKLTLVVSSITALSKVKHLQRQTSFNNVSGSMAPHCRAKITSQYTRQL